jgi:hypothetical protein
MFFGVVVISCPLDKLISQKARASAAEQCKAEIDEGHMVRLMRTLEWLVISRNSLCPHYFNGTPLACILPDP